MSEITKKDDPGLKYDMLYLGMTRPPTYLGVPLTAFLFETFGLVIVFLGTGSLPFLLLIVPVHGVLYLLGSSDPGRFDAWGKWVLTFGRMPNFLFWRAGSCSPLRLKSCEF